MKSITILLMILVFPAIANTQSLQVDAQTSNEEVLQAEISNGMINVESGTLSIGIAEYQSAEGGDPSLNAYVLPDGSVIVRENIANFLMIDSFGTIRNSVSNSTQSEGGEAISELSMSSNGKTVVVFNPKVNQNGQTGSRAKIIFADKNPLDVFFSRDRALSVVEVSANGEFIAFVSVKAGTDDQVQLMDRFGNILKTISFDQEVEGVTFSENGLYTAIYSGGRVAAYEVRSGERVGSTSFRNTSVQFAAYDPVDETIIALTASGNTNLSEIQLHAVNVAKRQIARSDLSGTLTKSAQAFYNRTGTGSYTIKGFDKELTIRARF